MKLCLGTKRDCERLRYNVAPKVTTTASPMSENVLSQSNYFKLNDLIKYT